VKNYGPETFGKLNAEDYDKLHDPGTTDASVNLIAELAAKGKVLELAIGTGRVALPLTQRGLEVHGIDASPEMVAKLRAKPGGEKVPVTIGDMCKDGVEGTFDFAFLIFNTLFNLTSQEEQVMCFQNAARHLNKGGAFLVETFIHDPSQFEDDRHFKTVNVDADTAHLRAAVHDPVTQVMHYQNIRITPTGTRMTPLPMRYAWPPEMDLMAQLAGLKLESRWGGWDRAPFTAKSTMHVSLYRKTSE
jgi:SAM-dependent methyltransferase